MWPSAACFSFVGFTCLSQFDAVVPATEAMGGPLILSNAQKSVPAHSPRGVFGTLDMANEGQVPQLVLIPLLASPKTLLQRLGLWWRPISGHLTA